MRSWHRITFPAQLLAQDRLAVGIMIKRAWTGKGLAARSKRSDEGFNRLNEGRQEQHDENDNLRPQREVREQ
jgi:hypothetical protein